jgi:hypothetical protein
MYSDTLYMGFKNKATYLAHKHFGDDLKDYCDYIERGIRADEAQDKVLELLEQQRAFDQSNAACELMSVALDQVSWIDLAIAASK